MLGDIQEGVSVEVVLPLATFPLSLSRFRTFSILRSLVSGSRVQLDSLPVLKYEYG